MKNDFIAGFKEDIQKIDLDIDEHSLPYDVELLSILKDAVIITDENLKVTYWNPAAEEIYGWKMGEVLGKDMEYLLKTKFMGAEDPKTLKDKISAGYYENEIVQYTKTEFPLYISTKVVRIKDGNGHVTGYISINRDMTRQKNTENKLKRSYNLLSSLFENTDDAISLKNLNGNYIMANTAVSMMVGKPISQILGKDDFELYSLKDARVIIKEDEEVLKTGKTITYEEKLFSHMEGEVRHYLTTKGPYRGSDDQILGIFGIGRDITHLKHAEEKIIESELKYRSLFSKMTEGFALHEIVCNSEGKPVDYRFIDINPAFEELTGLKRENIIGKLKSEVIPDDNVDWVEIYGDVALEGKSIRFDEYSEILKRHFEIYSFSPAKNQFAVLFTNTTERKNVERKLNDALKKLQISNSEIEKFAYIASHDMKEPLRMITNFLQLLQIRYKNKLDDDADEFIGYAIDGAIHMNELIDDLLIYSKLKKSQGVYTDVSMDEVLIQVRHNLNIFNNDKNIIITSTHLPVVLADKKQMVQLLENLISNSIKYCEEQTVLIHISAVKKGLKWLFSIEDNGIGIDPKYKDGIFKIFKRLHRKEEYPGTGIGLAISKRIVARHGGMIWTDSEYVGGSKFNFTIRR